ncbi:MAG TPA: hypothetical protein VIK14_14180 [Ignavibacteria bacterium]
MYFVIWLFSERDRHNISIAGRAINLYSFSVRVKDAFKKPFKFKKMEKEKKSANTIISSQDEFLGFVNSLSSVNSNKGRAKVKATVMDIPSLDLSRLRDLEEAIYLSGANIEFNLKGDVGVFTASLLSRRFKRTGFTGRNINLAISASVSKDDKEKLIDHIGQCVDSKSVDTVKSLVAKGATISMDDAKGLGLIDQVIDLSKRRGSKTTTAAVASDDTSVSENKTATS